MQDEMRWLLILVVLLLRISPSWALFTGSDRLVYREKARLMFYHAYDGYLRHAFPLDELKPLTCSGMDTWGGFALSLVDALDMLLVLGNGTEFVRAAKLVEKHIDTRADVNVSVFETNIRVVGGLLAAHLMSGTSPEVQLEDGWPCAGPLLRLAEQVAERLLPAFDTDTGMPYGTVNLKYGVHNGEVPITCTAGVGTFILEFGTLSRLTGNGIYEKVARRALDALWKSRSSLGLVGNHVNIHTGVWTATDAGIGAGVDSYFEYLVKGGQFFLEERWMKEFYEYEWAINKWIRKEDWFVWVGMTKGTVSLPVFQNLEAFWPGVLVLANRVDDAARIALQYTSTVRQYGFPPEFYNLPQSEAHATRKGYPLRPELIESLMYLYRATDDPTWMEIGAKMLDAIEYSSRTKCGYATIADVTTHSVEDRMESFFLAETTKYLYLLFDSDHFLHADGSEARIVETPNGHCAVYAGGWTFNTEAHPLDPSAVRCCSARKQAEREVVAKFERELDLVAMLNSATEPGNNGKKPKTKEGKKMQQQVLTPKEGIRVKKKMEESEEIEFEVDESLKGPERKETRPKDEQRKKNVKIEEEKPKCADVDENEDDGILLLDRKEAEQAPREEKPELPKKQAEAAVKEQDDGEKLTVRDVLRAARTMDDEAATKSTGRSNVADELLEKLRDIFDEWTLLVKNEQKLVDISMAEAEQAIRDRDRAAAIDRVPIVFCPESCLPLDKIGRSAQWRLFLSTILAYQIYPSHRIPFIWGPICRPHEAPSKWDHFKRRIPDDEDLASWRTNETEMMEQIEAEFRRDLGKLKMGHTMLTTTRQPFASRFQGVGQVAPRTTPHYPAGMN